VNWLHTIQWMKNHIFNNKFNSLLYTLKSASFNLRFTCKIQQKIFTSGSVFIVIMNYELKKPQSSRASMLLLSPLSSFTFFSQLIIDRHISRHNNRAKKNIYKIKISRIMQLLRHLDDPSTSHT
jgi:hypothetical protein